MEPLRPARPDVETFLITVYVEVDEWYQRHLASQRRGHPGRPARVTDSEVLTVALAQQLLGLDSERTWVALLRHNWGYLFPHLPTAHEVNRRVRHLMGGLRALWQHWAATLGATATRYQIVDTTAVPAVAYQRAHQARLFRGQAAYGRRGARQEPYYGFKLVLCTSLTGVPLALDVVPANVHDLAASTSVLADQHDRVILADKALRSTPWRLDLWQTQRLLVLAPPQRNQRVSWPRWLRRWCSRLRQAIERTLSQLKDHLALERHRARTLWGLCTRLYAKVAAFCLGVHLTTSAGFPAFALKQRLFPA